MRTLGLRQVAVKGQLSLEVQTSSAVEELRLALAYQGEGVEQRKLAALHELRRLLSPPELPPVKAALNAGAVTLLVQCLSFGSPYDQLYEAVWCLNMIAEAQPEELRSFIPAVPLLIAHLREKHYLPIAVLCASIIGYVARKEEELRYILLSHGALPPLSGMLVHATGFFVRAASWALSNLILGPDPKAAEELVRMDGVVDAFLRHLRDSNVKVVAEVAWVVAHLTRVSRVAAAILIRGDLIQLLVEILATSNDLNLLVAMVESLGNLVLADPQTMNKVLAVGKEITEHFIGGLTKCLKSEELYLKTEAAFVISNLAATSLEYKKFILWSEAVPVALSLLSGATLALRKEIAFLFGNLSVAQKDNCEIYLVSEHLVYLVRRGCLSGYIDLVRSGDIEAIQIGLLFIEMVLSEMPNGEGPRHVERENGVEALQRLQFHEHAEIKRVANNLVNTYFGRDYGVGRSAL